MTDDQFWRIIAGTGVLALVGAFKPQIKRLLMKLGYTGTGLGKPPDKKDTH